MVSGRTFCCCCAWLSYGGIVKRCSLCKEEKAYTEFHRNKAKRNGYQSRCKSCLNSQQARYRKEHAKDYNRKCRERRAIDSDFRERQNESNRRSQRKSQYGLTQIEFQALIDAQEGMCAICQKPTWGRELSIDHDHKTGKIRGLLCALCNMFLGRIDDSPDTLRRMIEYLKIKKEDLE